MNGYCRDDGKVAHPGDTLREREGGRRSQPVRHLPMRSPVVANTASGTVQDIPVVTSYGTVECSGRTCKHIYLSSPAARNPRLNIRTILYLEHSRPAEVKIEVDGAGVALDERLENDEHRGNEEKEHSESPQPTYTYKFPFEDGRRMGVPAGGLLDNVRAVYEEISGEILVRAVLYAKCGRL